MPGAFNWGRWVGSVATKNRADLTLSGMMKYSVSDPTHALGGRPSARENLLGPDATVERIVGRVVVVPRSVFRFVVGIVVVSGEGHRRFFLFSDVFLSAFLAAATLGALLSIVAVISTPILLRLKARRGLLTGEPAFCVVVAFRRGGILVGAGVGRIFVLGRSRVFLHGLGGAGESSGERGRERRYRAAGSDGGTLRGFHSACRRGNTKLRERIADRCEGGVFFGLNDRGPDLEFWLEGGEGQYKGLLQAGNGLLIKLRSSRLARVGRVVPAEVCRHQASGDAKR